MGLSIISDQESTADTALEMGLEHDSVGNSSVRKRLLLERRQRKGSL